MTKLTPQQLVEAFYAEVWNKQDRQRAFEILDKNFAFRGSLGEEKKGVAGFLEYADAVHHALSDYECVIRELVVSDERVAARMTFKGIHQNTFFGVETTGRMIAWSGAAFFETCDGKISRLWVLGDIDSIKRQLQD